MPLNQPISSRHTAVLGAGVIGASWTALFLAAGHTVAVYDPDASAEAKVRDYIHDAWPTLEALGLTEFANLDGLSFHTNAVVAVKSAIFIQESVPEQLSIKHALYAEIEESVETHAVIASSASGLTLSELQAGWKNPARLVLGHPFNPPHLIPLVEVMGNAATDEGVVGDAEDFYAGVGKVTIRVEREVPGHVANRLQAAVWREAIHLVKTGVASVEDVDKAMWAGPGLRWAAEGPMMLFHMGAGEGGLAEFCERYTDSFNRWWDDLGVLHLDQSTAEMLTAGVEAEAGGASLEQLTRRRDALITAMRQATSKHR